jgi:hypothetical protein
VVVVEMISKIWMLVVKIVVVGGDIVVIVVSFELSATALFSFSCGGG